MKNLVKLFGSCAIFGLTLTGCSIESNTDGEKKTIDSKEVAELSAPKSNLLIANNDMAFEMKGCKYRW